MTKLEEKIEEIMKGTDTYPTVSQLRSAMKEIAQWAVRETIPETYEGNKGYTDARNIMILKAINAGIIAE